MRNINVERESLAGADRADQPTLQLLLHLADRPRGRQVGGAAARARIALLLLVGVVPQGEVVLTCLELLHLLSS